MPGQKGMGYKVSDTYSLPLCARCHRAWHDNAHFPGMDHAHSVTLQYRAIAQCLSSWVANNPIELEDDSELF